MSETSGTIIGHIDAKSRSDASAIIVTAEKIAQREIEQAERRSKTRRDLAGRDLAAHLASEKGLADARAAAEASRMKLHEREQLAEKILAAALRRLAEAPRDDAYLGAVERLSREAAEALGVKEALLVVSPRDREYLLQGGRFDRLAGALRQSPGVEVRLSDETIHAAGGIVLRSIDGRVSYYNTFDEIAYRRRSELSATVSNLLFE